MSSDFSTTLALYELNELNTPTEAASAEIHHFAAAQTTASPSSSLLQAKNDIDAVRAWLAQYIDSPNTFASYRKESERLLLWCTQQRLKTLATLRHEDLLAYQSFLQQPKPVTYWIMPHGARYRRQDSRWRPFAGSLSTSSVQQALSILNNLFNWLVMAQYLPANPMALLRRQRKTNTDHAPTQRYLPRAHWQAVLETIEQWPQKTMQQQAQYRRYRWLFSLLYGTGLRVSEVCSHSMGDFSMRSSSNGEARWWLNIQGKGNRHRNIPITTELMGELAQYRQLLQLPPTPLPDEQTPLVMALRAPYQGIGRAQIHYLIKNIFNQTAKRLAKQGPEQQAMAHHIAQASTHWLRHTAGTHMVENNIDILHVRDTLGHQSLTTTNRYLHTAEEERHQHTQNKHRLGW